MQVVLLQAADSFAVGGVSKRGERESVGFEALQQRELREAFESSGEQAWTVLYSMRRAEDALTYQFCVLAPKRLRSEVLGRISEFRTLTTALRAWRRRAPMTVSSTEELVMTVVSSRS